jgi:hypothetical protein
MLKIEIREPEMSIGLERRIRRSNGAGRRGRIRAQNVGRPERSRNDCHPRTVRKNAPDDFSSCRMAKTIPAHTTLTHATPLYSSYNFLFFGKTILTQQRCAIQCGAEKFLGRGKAQKLSKTKLLNSSGGLRPSE